MIGVLLGVFSLLAAGRPTEFDLLVRGGRVVDGTGNPSYLANVGIKEGRIAAVGNSRAPRQRAPSMPRGWW